MHRFEIVETVYYEVIAKDRDDAIDQFNQKRYIVNFATLKVDQEPYEGD